MLRPCRFAALREVLPRSEKCDKAAFLMSAVQYIKELQVISQYTTQTELEQAYANLCIDASKCAASHQQA